MKKHLIRTRKVKKRKKRRMQKGAEDNTVTMPKILLLLRATKETLKG